MRTVFLTAVAACVKTCCLLLILLLLFFLVNQLNSLHISCGSDVYVGSVSFISVGNIEGHSEFGEYSLYIIPLSGVLCSLLHFSLSDSYFLPIIWITNMAAVK